MTNGAEVTHLSAMTHGAELSVKIHGAEVGVVSSRPTHLFGNLIPTPSSLCLPLPAPPPTALASRAFPLPHAGRGPPSCRAILSLPAAAGATSGHASSLPCADCGPSSAAVGRAPRHGTPAGRGPPGHAPPAPRPRGTVRWRHPGPRSPGNAGK
jgi:hypothetical protein